MVKNQKKSFQLSYLLERLSNLLMEDATKLGTNNGGFFVDKFTVLGHPSPVLSRQTLTRH